MKVQSINQINNALQQYFRASKRVRINGRNGAFVVVDDRKEAVDLVKNMFIVRGEDQIVLSATNVTEAQTVIQNNEIRAVIIDLTLDGKGKNGDGFNLADWLNDKHPEIPFMFATGREERVKEIEKKFPGVDIFVKGIHNTDDFACALGMEEEDQKGMKTIPRDEGVDQEIKKSSFSFFKKVFSFVF